MFDGKEVKLSDVAHLGGGYAFKSTQYTEAGRFILRTVNIRKDTSITKGGAKFISEEEAAQFERFSLKEHDTLFVMVAATLGKIGYVRASDLPALLNQNMWVIRAKDNLINPIYLHYFFRELSKIPLTWVAGSARSFLRRDDVRNLEFVLPNRITQQGIAETLKALDDKIALNRRMNETLEAMARAIFKDWFVDFGPTRAKAEGRAPYLAAELWDLFPDALDDGDKPFEWKVSEIGREVDAVGGATPSTKEPSYWEGGEYHWATPKDLSKLSSPVLLDTARKITQAGVKKISSGLLPVGTVLLSSRAPIGYLAVAEVPTAVNQGFISMVCEKRLPNVFVLFWCYENLDHIKSISGGSTFAEISKKVFRPVPVIVPSERVLEAYEVLVRPLYTKIVANMKESTALAQTRDFLLPRLMSGEIRLRNADKFVTNVA